MNVHKIRLAKQSGTLFIEEDKSLLFLAGQQEVVMLSSLATLILINAENNNAVEVNLNYLSEELSLPIDELNREYQKLSELLSPINSCASYGDGQYPELDKAPDSSFSLPLSKQIYIEISDRRFLVESADKELQQEIVKLLSPLGTSENQPDFIIRVNKNAHGYQIYSNGLIVRANLMFEEVIPELIDRLQILSYQKTDYFCCFHGAAIQQGQSIYFLPGESGKGKSTLCAALHEGKNRVYSDEFIVLSDELKPLELYLPIAVKAGSWEHLTSEYPELEQASEWKRLDGRQVKYAWPCRVKLSGREQPTTKYHFVFPNYIAGHNSTEATVKELSVIETFQKLIEGGYQLRSELTEQSLEHLILFIECSTRIELCYSSTNQALTALERYCG